MNSLNDERLALNQKFCELVDEYLMDNWDGVEQHADGKEIFKHIWHKGYMIVPKDNSIY